MATHYRPDISAQDFEAFKKIPTLGLPASHGEWTSGELLANKDVALGGHQVQTVPVDPKEFVRYCAKVNVKSDLNES
jgi:hypothetical protein